MHVAVWWEVLFCDPVVRRLRLGSARRRSRAATHASGTPVAHVSGRHGIAVKGLDQHSFHISRSKRYRETHAVKAYKTRLGSQAGPASIARVPWVDASDAASWRRKHRLLLDTAHEGR